MEMNANTLEAEVTNAPRTYTVRESQGGGAWFIVSTPVSDSTDTRYEVGPFHTKNAALAEANLLASAAVGNRVES